MFCPLSHMKLELIRFMQYRIMNHGGATLSAMLLASLIYGYTMAITCCRPER